MKNHSFSERLFFGLLLVGVLFWSGCGDDYQDYAKSGSIMVFNTPSRCAIIDIQKGVRMGICGLQKTTLLDYPEHVAATVFVGGCNFRCPFCHNMELVEHPELVASITEPEVLSFLKKRQGLLDGICITGGEPTLWPGLPDFIKNAKDLGYLVKLDSNGYHPEVLSMLIEAKLVDYIAMDIKASKDHYGRAAGLPNIDISKIQQSIDLIMNSQLPYEFRTTVVKGIHSIQEFAEIGKWLQGCNAYYLQSFRTSPQVPNQTLDSFTEEELKAMQDLARKFIDRVEIRI